MNVFLGAFSFFLGALTWTFCEYWLHRTLGHRRGATNPFSREHLRHHADVSYFAPTSKKVLAAGTIIAVATPPLAWAFGVIGVLASLGFVTMYVAYELVHRRLHTHPGTTRYGRWARRHHLFHHYSRPHRNEGVTTPLWDWVFGTLEVPAIVKVPPKNALGWMLDDRGELKPELVAEYQLGRAKAEVA